MIKCISCGREQEAEQFGLKNKHDRREVCRTCTRERLAEDNVKKMLENRDNKIRILTNIQRDTVNAYLEKDYKRLKLCIERMKVETKGVHLKKQGVSNDEM